MFHFTFQSTWMSSNIFIYLQGRKNVRIFFNYLVVIFSLSSLIYFPTRGNVDLSFNHSVVLPSLFIFFPIRGNVDLSFNHSVVLPSLSTLIYWQIVRITLLFIYISMFYCFPLFLFYTDTGKNWGDMSFVLFSVFVLVQ